MNKYNGLSSLEVSERIEQGLSNRVEVEKPKSSARIVFEQIFRVYNLYLIMIALALIAVQEYLSVFFLNVLIMNVVIQSYQIIRSVKTVSKLNVLIAQSNAVIRDGKMVYVSNEDLVMDDIVYLKTGDQLVADCTFLGDKLEMNESMITGESKSVNKDAGDLLYSGSFVSSGVGYAKVTQVGAQAYIQKIMTEARKFKEVRSELMDTFSDIARFFVKIVGPIGFVLLLQSIYIRKETIKQAVVTSSTVLLGLLPVGLVLLASISFAVSVYRLGRKQTLVQSVYSIETLSKVDVICIDKTGTLTEGNMSVSDITYLKDTSIVDRALEHYLLHTQDSDSTTRALQGYFAAKGDETLIHKLAFSSNRKWGAMTFSNIGSIYLGAPDFLVPGIVLPKSVSLQQDLGSRVLLLAHSKEMDDDYDDHGPLTPYAYIIIEDALRSDASTTLDFFNNNEVQIKIISGDHIKTLLAVASAAGIQNGHKAIDVSTLTTDKELEEAVMNYNVIGRASPYQKQTMVKMLQKNNKKVAMVGDGVNDVLALRSADCSVAMGAGSGAAIAVAEVVLLDNQFSAMVEVVMEGRLVTNNIARSASMYYLATLTIFILTVFSIFTNSSFPFIPIQMTIMSMFVEGLPSTLVTFEASFAKPKEGIVKQVLRNILPIGISLSLAYILLFTFNIDLASRQSMLYYIVIFLSYMLVVKIFQPMNLIRIAVLLVSSSILIAICYIFASYLNLVGLSQNDTIIIVAVIGFTYIFWMIVDWLFTNIIYPLPKQY